MRRTIDSLWSNSARKRLRLEPIAERLILLNKGYRRAARWSLLSRPLGQMASSISSDHDIARPLCGFQALAAPATGCPGVRDRGPLSEVSAGHSAWLAQQHNIISRACRTAGSCRSAVQDRDLYYT